VSETTTGRSLAKGLLAGLVAGLVATAAKSCVEKFYPPRVHGEPEPPEALAEKLADHDTKAYASEAIHWGFGAAVGAAYGALAEYFPAATAKEGATFGLTLMTLTHETALPAMGLSEEAGDQSARERTSEATSHLIYGLVAERVRSFVRQLL
jgi:putative membrane protein